MKFLIFVWCRVAYPVGCWLPSIWRRRMLVLLAQSWCYRFVSSRTWAKSAKCGTLGSNLTLPTLTSCRLRVSLATPGYNMCTHALVSEELKFGRIHTHGPIVVRVDLADPPTLFFFLPDWVELCFSFLSDKRILVARCVDVARRQIQFPRPWRWKRANVSVTC